MRTIQEYKEGIDYMQRQIQTSTDRKTVTESDWDYAQNIVNKTVWKHLNKQGLLEDQLSYLKELYTETWNYWDKKHDFKVK